MWQAPATSLKTLKEIVGGQNAIFCIPQYQRPYAWETKQLEDLWNDVQRIPDSEEDGHYLMGTLSVRHEKRLPTPKPLYEYYQDLGVLLDATPPPELPHVDEHMDDDDDDDDDDENPHDMKTDDGGGGVSVVSIGARIVSRYFVPVATPPPISTTKRQKLVRERFTSARHLTSRSFDTVHCYSVIDGQQRLTTLMIMLRAIYEKLGQKHSDERDARRAIMEQYLFLPLHSSYTGLYAEKLVLANDTHAFFVRMLLGMLPEKPRTRYVAEQRLHDALLFFRRKLEHKSDEFVHTAAWSPTKASFSGTAKYHYSLYLQELLIKLTQRLHFNMVVSHRDVMDAHVLFEVNNCRGTHLTTLELVKNRLMYVASRMANEALVGEIHATWSGLYRKMMHSGLGKRDDEEQLLYTTWQAFHTMKVGAGRKVYDEMCKEYNPDNVDSGEARKRLCDDVRLYLDRLRLCTIVYCNLYSPFREEVLLDMQITVENRYDLQEAIVNLHRIGSLGMFVPLLMAVALRDQQLERGGALLLPMLRICEKYVMRVYRIAETRNDAGKNDILRIAGFISLETITFADLYKTLTERIVRHCPEGTMRRFLQSRSRNFAEWSAIRHFLMQYEMAHNPANTIQYDEVTLEHILPREYRDAPYWVEQFKDADKCEAHVQRLGNLTLSQAAWNSSYGSRSFPEKRDGDPKGYARSPLRIESELARSEKWDSDEVFRRQERLTEWAIQRFSV